MNPLPPMVSRYVDRVLALAPLARRRVRITQRGEMLLRPGTRARRFTATEEFAITTVEFEWRARFPLFGPLSLHVVDTYRRGDGLLAVRLLGLPLQRRQGPELAQAEAYRYLAELPWAPHAIVGNRELEWRQVDGSVVDVVTEAAGEQISVRLRFNAAGQIARAEAERPRAEAGNARVPWVGDFWDYTLIGGTIVPRLGAVSWQLPEGTLTYWRGRITSFEVGD